MIVQVVINTPLRKTFDYLAEQLPVVGARVQVSFGRRKMVGVVVGFSENATIAPEKLKYIESIIDEVPLLDASLLAFCQRVSDYYHHPIGEVIVGTLPKKIRTGELCENFAHQVPSLNSVASLILTDEQTEAVNHISAAKTFQPFLLFGITGSGKTEVYLRVIESVLAVKKQALVLVPEIALTPQTVTRFQARLSVPILLLHSGLTDKQRCMAWMQARENEPCVVIGTRSAVFAPLQNIGVIVVDEEHDMSFKQQTGFRYSARDAAVFRAKMLNIPIVLGSATPSVESWHNVEKKKYALLTLSKRAGVAELPKIILHDVRHEKLNKGLSAALIEKIKTHLSAGNQVLLYLNRRGYAPIVLCHHCGFHAKCKRCDSRLTLHLQPKKLHCHHCDYQTVVPRTCPDCQQHEVITFGLGTEQLVETMTALFPDKKIIQVDRDVVKNVKILEKTLEAICSQEADIIIGTQMLVKGHHFEHVTLVAAMDVDQALFSGDFRAVERLGQSLLQVAGRAGRAEKKGEVFIQTHQPDHPLFKTLFTKKYTDFSKDILQERVAAQLPPVAFLAVLRAEAKDKARAHAFLTAARRYFPELTVAGPFPVVIEKKAGVYRAQLLLNASHRGLLKKGINTFLQQQEKQKKVSGVKWVLDIDPVEVV